jgi:phosphatidylethanolamine/phosphatidyl-N-methylethanolamine N-methyltransferase
MRQHIASARQRANEALVFLSHWVQSPMRMGSLAPSSRALARAMARQIPPAAMADTAPIIELGGGTGSITAGLLEAGIPAGRLVVIERDRRLADHLSRRFHGVRVVCEDAAALRAVMFNHGAPHAAAIVSGLPLLLFPEEARDRIVEACFTLLGPERPLIQFTYGPNSPVPYEDYGLVARRTGRVWMNLPPATVWTYRLPYRPVQRTA